MSSEKQNNKTAGTRMLHSDVTADLLDQFDQFMDQRPNESKRDHIEFMLRRHLANPPAQGEIPVAAPRKRGRPAGSKKKAPNPPTDQPPSDSSESARAA